jgi:hypothetical protein
MVFLGAERGVVEILQKVANLFAKGHLHMLRRGGALPEEVP